MKKRIMISILIIVLILSAVLIYTNELLKPLPEGKRNISSSNVKMLVNIEDSRTAIIRTYTKEEFDKFNENEIKKIKEIVDGNIEGDVPALTIADGVGTLELSFESINEAEISAKIVPDNIPKIKISVPYGKEESKIISDSLIESKETEGIYLYEIKRYLNQDEAYYGESDEFFMESMFIEINYEINKENYVSIFAINTIEYKD